jgi:hypothetical protein
LKGAHKRDTGIDLDYVIEDLEATLELPSIQASRAVWMTMFNADAEVLEATFKANRQQSLRTRPSRLVLVLRELEWVPLADGRFVKPSHAAERTVASILPFDSSNGWMTALGFGEAEKRETANYRKKGAAAVRRGREALGKKFERLFPLVGRNLLKGRANPVVLLQASEPISYDIQFLPREACARQRFAQEAGEGRGRADATEGARDGK